MTGSGAFAAEPGATPSDPLGSDPLGLLPRPRVVRRTGGVFRITSGNDIRQSVDPGLPAEAYVLDVNENGISITGGDDAGLDYARQTLLQLLPADRFTLDGTFGGVGAAPVDVPHLHIEDAPAYPWRGFMLDVARHFLPRDGVLRVLDLLAAHKLNVLHLHLTDDQGWRIPIPAYPRLTEVGGWRSETIVGFDHERADYDTDGLPHGGAYTRADLEEIVAYAAARHIEVVPEIDLPGHMTAAIAAYPELGSGEPAEVRTRWGISTRILHLDEPTLTFVRAVLAEVVDIFPSAAVHAGGDEVPKKEWRESTTVQEQIAELGLGGEAALQGWFTEQVAAMLHEHGRRLVAWDEVVNVGAPSDTLVMAWRSTEHGVNAALAGYDVIMSPSEYVYFDHAQSTDATEPVTFPDSPLPLRRVFEFEPLPEALRQAAADGGARRGTVLGAQAHLWREYVPTALHTEYMMFPRLCAFAEAVWRQPLDDGGTRDFAEFSARLEAHLRRLSAAGVGFRPLDPGPTR